MYSVKPAWSSLFLRIFKAFYIVQTSLILNSLSYCILIYLSVITSATALFFTLIPWSTEALWVHLPARASKTLSRKCSVPSPHREGAWGLREESKPHARDFIGFLRKPRTISLFLSFTFLSSTPDYQVLVH